MQKFQIDEIYENATIQVFCKKFHIILYIAHFSQRFFVIWSFVSLVSGNRFLDAVFGACVYNEFSIHM